MQELKMRKFPIILVLAAAIFINEMSLFRGRSFILAGLGEFAFTIFLLLALVAFFSDISAGQASSFRRLFAKIKALLKTFFGEEIYIGFKTEKFFDKIKTFFAEYGDGKKQKAKEPGEEKEQKSEQSIPLQPAISSLEISADLIVCEGDIPRPSGAKKGSMYPESDSLPEQHTSQSLLRGMLIEIQKDKIQDQKEEKSEKNRHLSALFIAFFAGIALWRISRIFNVVPLSFNEYYSYSIVHALFLLFFYCTAVIYLKIKKDSGKYTADKTSDGILRLFSYVLLLYAAVIGASVVLNIDILFVPQWAYYAASVYLLAALAVNILLDFFKKNILGNFDYTIIPKTLKTGKADSAAGSFLDSEDVKINFSLKSLYTVKYTLKIIPAVILSLGFILLLSTTVFVVQPHQQAAVFRQGRLERSSIFAEGIHFKLPWPVSTVNIYDVHRIRSLQIGSESLGDGMNFLWTNVRGGGDFLLLLGNGNEAAAVNMNIFYKISDLYYYLKTSANPQAELIAAAYRALMNRTVNTTLDAFLSVDRSLLSASILDELSAFSRAENLGLSVVQVVIENIHPPVEIADIYQRVASAAIDKTAIIINAGAYAERMIIDAQRQSIAAVDNAIAEQYYRVSAAQKEMAVFYAAMEAYQLNPRSFRLARYLETFEKVVDGNRVFVFSPGTEASIPRSVIGRADMVNIWD